MSDAAQKIHQLIVEGKGSAAREELKEILQRRVERTQAARVAQLAWRVDMPEMGLRVLAPIVRPSARSRVTPTDDETAEYAHCLIKFGAVDEGETLLDEISPAKCPRTLLYKVSALVSRWDYAGTIPLLEKFLKLKGVEPYQKLVGQANLAAALVYEKQWKKAGPLLSELLYTCSLRRYTLLLGRTLELSAESQIARGKYDEAEKFLSEAHKKLVAAGGIDAFFVAKFRIMLEVWRTGGSAQSMSDLHVLREEAKRRRHWETVRDCDRCEAVTTRDISLFRHVFFGTPYIHYRERLLADFGPVDEAKLQNYELKLGGTEKKSTRVIDPETSPELKSGSLLQRLALALTSDFYRPQRLGALHAKLYPDRFFDPIGSPAKVYNVMHRLRDWFSEEKIPVVIDEENGFFRLDATAAISIRVSRRQELAKPYGRELAKLSELWPKDTFSIGEAEKATGIARRTLFRLLQQALDEGHVTRQGSGKATRYLFGKS